MSTIKERFMAAYTAFREPNLVSGADVGVYLGDFDSWEGRRARYAVYEAFYNNVQYRRVHSFASSYLALHSLYRGTRSIYNPVARSCEFMRAYIWGGALDARTGLGGALPIVTENAALPAYITQLWRWSNWAVKKDIVPLRGSILGDVILRVVEDTRRKTLYFESVPPALIADLTVDPQDNVKGYVLSEMRPHPENPSLLVEYREEVTRGVGLDVVYRTFLNDKPYGWYGLPAEFSVGYGFVPMVHIKHLDVGASWGRAEMHTSRGKLDELNHLASLVSDHIARSTRTGFLLAGVSAPKPALAVPNTARTDERPEPARDEVPLLYGAENARPWPLTMPLDYGQTTLYMLEIMKELERDHPELKFDSLRASGTVSGDALLVARQPAEKLIEQRRAGYDNSLVRLQQMALTVGGMRGYFAGIAETSFQAGDLEHQIGDRPVFADAVEPAKPTPTI